ncbi:MAG: UPF0182 family protein [Candidatus Latescibacteria bacterium]|nr:UPF0182 family protein [Candidatus Latescibacterota bacterium]
MSKQTLGIIAVAASIALGFIGLRLLAVVYTDLLWFDTLTYRDAFITMTFTKTLSLFGSGALFALFAGINLYFARQQGQATRVMAFEVVVDGTPEMPPNHSLRQRLAWSGGIALLSFMMGVLGASAWLTYLRYFNPTPFAHTDPIFGNDISFYVFSLPLYTFLHAWAIAAVLLTAFLVAVSYHQDRAIRHDDDQDHWITIPEVRAHISILAGFLALLLGWGYWLKEYELLYSFRKDAFFGAGFTDLNAQFLAYKFMLVLLLAIAGLLFYNTRIKTWAIPLYGVIAYGSSLIVISWLLPMIYEEFKVKPNEFEREEPYIQYGIDYTRKAYGLDRVHVVDFPGNSDLTTQDIENNQLTIQSIPLWDRRPLMATYSQLQEIRSYYRFNSVDVDRYTIDGTYQQVMLAGREFTRDASDLQVDTWVNNHLVYTHGYGLVMSPANEIVGEGLPGFIIKDIPPTSPPELPVARPEIYYGENMRNYVVVNTNTPEFDYPKGDENVYTTYQGKGGVPVGGFWKRLVFALRFGDPYLLFTGALNADSRLMYDRHIGQRLNEDSPKRLSKIAPFLNYDSDPYLTLIDGRLLWIQDAYTVTNMYPYSFPFGRPYLREMNYIRNSVKVVLDAYDGTVTYYAWDEEDPLLKTYRKIFPGLIQPKSTIPKSLIEHLRYPLDLFDIQAELYNTYHMTSANVFYNREDVWETPTEFYGTMDRPISMSPYYATVRLPEAEKEEYILMLPATPSGRPNMIGWVFARCDAPNYGDLVVYKLPKEKLIYGPVLIERRINQDTEVSREITLWDQRGSDVIRGNLLVIPIENSFIYVEPLYLRASQSGMPELKRVLVIHGEKLAMGVDLKDALEKVFKDLPAPKNLALQTPKTIPQTLQTLAKKAFQEFEQAQQYLKEGNFTQYGQSIESLEQTLTRMNQKETP